MIQGRKLRPIPIVVNFSEPYSNANIFLGLIEYKLNSPLCASHLVKYISVHIIFEPIRYLLTVHTTVHT